MLKEFKKFIAKGNVMDLAVGVVIGGAFQAIVNSLVNDIIMPLVSAITGNVDFSDRVIEIGDVSIKYGNFITSIVDFILIAFCIFIMIRTINKWQEKMENAKFEEKFGKQINDKIKKLDKTGKLKEKIEKEEAEREKVVEPTVKICPYCLSEIPYKATKCAHCTSDLNEKLN